MTLLAKLSSALAFYGAQQILTFLSSSSKAIAVFGLRWQDWGGPASCRNGDKRAVCIFPKPQGQEARSTEACPCTRSAGRRQRLDNVREKPPVHDALSSGCQRESL